MISQLDFNVLLEDTLWYATMEHVVEILMNFARKHTGSADADITDTDIKSD